MKTFLSILTLAVPAAFLAPLSVEAVASLLFTLGIIVLALHDYTHRFRPWVAAPAASGVVKRHRERLGLAA